MRLKKQSSRIALRPPVAEDAVALHALIADSPPLDGNSLYCNLLHCTHFSLTSVAALDVPSVSSDSPEAVAGQSIDDPVDPARLLGFISAYIPPAQPDTLFVWQVVVDVSLRGQRLAARMLDHILQRPSCAAVRYVDTTITAANQASRRMFTAWAARHQAQVHQALHFERERHLGGAHDSEYLVRIGPFRIGSLALAAEAAT